MRTRHPAVWVAGDATGRYQVLHLANQYQRDAARVQTAAPEVRALRSVVRGAPAIGIAAALDGLAPCIDAFVCVDRHGLDFGGLGRCKHLFDAGDAGHDLAGAVFA